jgi:NACHT domain
LIGKAWQPLTAVLVAFGIPAAVAAEWRHLVARHPFVAGGLALVWLVVCGAGLLVRQALSGPARRRLEQAGNAADRAAGWWLSGYDRRYRQWVLDSVRYVDVKDLATGGDHTPELDYVYVDVALVSRAPHQVSGNPLRGVREDAAGRHSISEFLDRREQVVLAVVGPPGSGKSTLLAHAARRCAQAGHRNRRRVPVLLALREHAGAVAADPRITLPDVLRPAVRGVPGKEPDGWWERQLRRGRCMILLDGLDEVASEEERRAVATWVGRQISSYPGNHFVVTSRPHGYPGPVIAQADVLAIRPFTAEQVRLFVNRWSLAAERHAAGAVSKAQLRAARTYAGESAARLLSLLRARPALHDLTVNPLLLTMIATVHRYRGALPGSRADLYGEICQVMLSRRIQAKDLPELLPWPVKHQLLTALAYQMMHMRVSELPAGEALRILDPLLGRLPQSVTGQVFLDDISRDGLLVQPVLGRYAFTHLTFQEYLAAQHIAASPGLAKTLAGSVSDPWWRETTLLYTATADADPIVHACLDSATIPALTLAFDCADTSSALALDLRQRLDQVREQAYEPDCDPRHRRLIAAVLAARLARETLTTSAGTRICDRPVPTDLYWLFLQDTPSPPPDSPCEPSPDRPATGIWGSEAMTFLEWLNTITAGSGQAEFRLPYMDELWEQAVASVLTGQLPGSVTSAWTQPRQGGDTPGLWVIPGQPPPHLVTGGTIRQAIAQDTSNTEILAQVSDMAAFSATVALDIVRDHAFGRAFDLDLAHVSGLTHVFALIPGAALDIDLPRAHVTALDRGHVSALDRALVTALDRALVRVLTLARESARESGRALARALLFALASDGRRARALASARALARDLDRALDRTLSLARALDLGPARDLDPDFGLMAALARAVDLDPALARGPDLRVHLLGLSGIPLRWVSSGELGRVWWKVTTARTPPSEARQAFADELTSGAGIERTPVTACLDGSLTRRLRDISSTASTDSPGEHASRAWDHPAAGASLLADASAALFNGHRHPGVPEAAAITAVALALASDSAEIGDDKALSVFRTVAATVTLLQHREQNTAKIGESIILALT